MIVAKPGVNPPVADPQHRALCEGCLSTFRRAPARRLGDLPVFSAYVHVGPAATAIHQLKYRGHVGLLDVFVPSMRDAIPTTARVLIPVPRVWSRRIRYGVDPAVALAVALGKVTGLSVVHALTAPLIGSPRAGRQRQQRHNIRFGARLSVREAVLIDDVVTTGATLLAAVSALDRSAVIAGLTATGVA
ncbi:MAG: ComF family protein [Acidimicrobiia bacterium]|nr:ComF family protein [Acidimicrobiia bacterium]